MTSFGTIIVSCLALAVFTSAKPFGGQGCGEDNVEYSYGDIAAIADLVNRLVRQPAKDFMKMNCYAQNESPTAKAIAEYNAKVTEVKFVGGDECVNNGQEDKIKSFKKSQAAVVAACQTGWKASPELSSKATAVLKTLQELDDQAKAQISKCTRREFFCIRDFKQSDLGKSVDQQLAAIKESQVADMRAASDESHIQNMVSFGRCEAEGSADIRKDIYTALASLNVCAAENGIKTKFL